MWRSSRAVTWAYRLIMAAFDQPMTSIAARSGDDWRQELLAETLT
jgi:hypothetical protein